MSGELHVASLLWMNRVMKCMGIQPFGNHLIFRLLCSLVLVLVPSYYYYSFEYDSENFFKDKPILLAFDLIIYATMIIIHIVVVIERTWRNYRHENDDQLEEILLQINKLVGKEVNLQRVRAYCYAAYGSLFIRCLMLVLVTVYTNQAVIYCDLYSELVMLVCFTEFTLYCAVILFLYQEITLAGTGVLQELHGTRFELSSVRRLSLQKLENLQRIHSLMWKSIRGLEGSFHLSLVTMLMKYFVDSATLPYWIYHVERMDISNQFYCGIDECVKIMEVVVPCWICTRCDVMQRRFRSMFYTLTKDRRNAQLNAALNRLCLQLGQERCQFSAGGLVEISTEMLGKFLFGMISYIVICIQFSLNIAASNSSKVAKIPTTMGPL